MKSEDLKKIKEKVKELQTKKNEVLELQKKISKLKETEQVKKYLELLDILEEKTTGINKEIDKIFEELKPTKTDIGKVMGRASGLLKGKADLSVVNKLIKERLNNL